jgi:hypothetical protein
MQHCVAWLLALLVLRPGLAGAAPGTSVRLTDVATERRIAAATLAEGEEAVLTWTNTLFGLRGSRSRTPRAASRPACGPRTWTTSTTPAGRSTPRG